MRYDILYLECCFSTINICIHFGEDFFNDLAWVRFLVCGESRLIVI